MKRGAFIVMEGCDRAGKSTQCQKLLEHFKSQGKNVEKLNFPDRTTATGKLISHYLEGKTDLNNKAVHLLFSANRWEAESKILQTLNDGITIICDRYAYSGVAYSSAKKGLDLNWCKQPDIGLPNPDLVIFLDVPPSALETRQGFGVELYEKVQFQSTVRDQFLKLKENNWRVIDATKSIQKVNSEVLKCVSELTDTFLEPIRVLWEPT